MIWLSSLKAIFVFYIIASLLLSLILVIPLYLQLPSVYTVLIVIILLGVCFFCYVAKNLYDEKLFYL